MISLGCYIGSLRIYEKYGISPGGFLISILRNDLATACSRCNNEEGRFIWEIHHWIFNNLPRKCYGTEDRVSAWIETMPRKVGDQ